MCWKLMCNGGKCHTILIQWKQQSFENEGLNAISYNTNFSIELYVTTQN